MNPEPDTVTWALRHPVARSGDPAEDPVTVRLGGITFGKYEHRNPMRA